MTMNDLRWSSIDGKSWTASCHQLVFKIELNSYGEDEYYVAKFRNIELNDGKEWELIGSFGTIATAKTEIKEYI